MKILFGMILALSSLASANDSMLREIYGSSNITLVEPEDFSFDCYWQVDMGRNLVNHKTVVRVGDDRKSQRLIEQEDTFSSSKTSAYYADLLKTFNWNCGKAKSHYDLHRYTAKLYKKFMVLDKDYYFNKKLANYIGVAEISVIPLCANTNRPSSEISLPESTADLDSLCEIFISPREITTLTDIDGAREDNMMLTITSEVGNELFFSSRHPKKMIGKPRKMSFQPSADWQKPFFSSLVSIDAMTISLKLEELNRVKDNTVVFDKKLKVDKESINGELANYTSADQQGSMSYLTGYKVEKDSYTIENDDVRVVLDVYRRCYAKR